MATWTVSLDKPVAVESPNAVAYVTYSADDGRTIPGVRIPYAAEVDLLNFLARECARLAELDTRGAEMAAVVASSELTPGASIALPDISKQSAANAAQNTLNDKVNAALLEKLIAEALAFDPTIADAQAALAAVNEAAKA